MSAINGNKGEAERCIEIAIDAAQVGNYQRAEKFLRKADALFPTQKAKELLQRLRAEQKNQKTDETLDDGLRKRKFSDSRQSTSETSFDCGFTQEQLILCDQIKKCKDYYEVLSVTKEATDNEIKKSYKRLALQLHPDKNRAPGAVEAFKILGKAAGVLTDSEKRKSYDLYGASGKRLSTRHHYHANHEYEHAYRDTGSDFETDFTAEELFNMFFGNGFPQHRTTTHSSRRYQQNRHEMPYYQSQQQPSLAFGIILILILISMLSSFFTSDSIYSLSQSPKYPVMRKTIHLNIPYYVKEHFETDYQGSLARLENAVEEEYIIVMKQACYRERSYREVMMARARSFGNEQQFEQAKMFKVTSCENLARLGLTKFMPTY